MNEFGLPTTKYKHLVCLHRILKEYEETILYNDRPAPELLENQVTAYSYTKNGQTLVFLCNDTEDDTATIFQTRRYQLRPKSVTLISNGEVLMNTGEMHPQSVVRAFMQKADIRLTPFRYLPEPVPGPSEDTVKSFPVYEKPAEQLQFTRDETDYCWYVTP